MRKTRVAKMIGVLCGVMMASGALAAEQAAAPAAGDAAAPAAEAPKTEGAKGLLSSAFTKFAPRFGGDANIEFDTRDSHFGDGLTSRVRLTMDADIDPTFYIHTRLTAKQYVYGNQRKKGESSSKPAQAAGYENEAIKVGMEQLYIGARLGKATEVRVGRQPLWLANGMLADINGINSAMVKTSLLGTNAFAIFGVEGSEGLYYNNGDTKSNLGAAEISRAFGPVELGATYLKVRDTYIGFNANYVTPINKLVLFGQYAQNTSADDLNQGYWAGARYGNAGKKGEWDASLAYVRVENNINPNNKWFVNDGNLVGAKGVRLKAHYALSDWSTLVLVQDFCDSIVTGKGQNRTDVEFEVRF